MREIEELMLKECQILSPALLEFSLILFFVNKAILICVCLPERLVKSLLDLLMDHACERIELLLDCRVIMCQVLESDICMNFTLVNKTIPV